MFSIQSMGFLHAEQFCQNLTMFPQLSQSHTGLWKRGLHISSDQYQKTYGPVFTSSIIHMTLIYSLYNVGFLLVDNVLQMWQNIVGHL